MAQDNKYGRIDIPGVPDDEPVSSCAVRIRLRRTRSGTMPTSRLRAVLLLSIVKVQSSVRRRSKHGRTQTLRTA